MEAADSMLSMSLEGNEREVGNVDKGVVEGRENAGDTEDELAWILAG